MALHHESTRAYRYKAFEHEITPRKRPGKTKRRQAVIQGFCMVWLDEHRHATVVQIHTGIVNDRANACWPFPHQDVHAMEVVRALQHMLKRGIVRAACVVDDNGKRRAVYKLARQATPC